MCAINPKRQHQFLLTVYTSHDMDEETFLSRIRDLVLETEQRLNLPGHLRWHITEYGND